MVSNLTAHARLPAVEPGFRVLQWNILLQSDEAGCIDEHMRQYVTPLECLEWSYRCQAIAQRVLDTDVDVAFLEECSQSMLSDLLARLTGYKGWHAGAIDGGVNSEDMDVVVLMKESIRVLGSPRCCRLYWQCAAGTERDAALIPHGFPASAYVVLSAAVQSPAGSVVVLAGTHLRWEYGDGFGGAAAGKPLQALAAARHLKQHVTDTGAAGWLLAGDFNSRPDDAAVALLKTGELIATHPELLQCVSHRLVLPFDAPLLSAYECIYGHDPAYTRKKNEPGTQYCLDYIFVGGALKPIAAGFGAGPPPYSKSDGSDLVFLPNADWPSDHLPIVADLSVVSEEQ